MTDLVPAELPIHLDLGLRLYAHEHLGNRIDVSIPPPPYGRTLSTPRQPELTPKLGRPCSASSMEACPG